MSTVVVEPGVTRILIPDRSVLYAYRLVGEDQVLSRTQSRLEAGTLLRVDRVGNLQSDRTLTLTLLTPAHGRPTNTSYHVFLGDQVGDGYALLKPLFPERAPVQPETDAQKIARLEAEVEALQAQKRAWIARHNDLVAALQGAIATDANSFSEAR